MKALSLTIQKPRPMKKYLRTKKLTNGQVKNYMPPIYRCVGIKNQKEKKKKKKSLKTEKINDVGITKQEEEWWIHDQAAWCKLNICRPQKPPSCGIKKLI